MLGGEVAGLAGLDAKEEVGEDVVLHADVPPEGGGGVESAGGVGIAHEVVAAYEEVAAEALVAVAVA